MAKRSYVAYCQICSFSRRSEDPRSFDLVPIPESNVQGRIPQYKLTEKKWETFPDVTRMPKYRCPKCGRAVMVKIDRTPGGNLEDTTG